VSFALWHALRTYGDQGLARLILVVLIVFGVSGLVYLGLARLLRVEELSVVGVLLRRGRRGPSGVEETEAVP